MPYTDNNTILLAVSEYPPYFEMELASGQLRPGSLVIERSPISGDLPSTRFHDTADEAAEKLFLLENPDIGTEIEDLYVAGDRVRARVMRAGDIFLARVGNGTINWGTFLTSHGDGSLHPYPAIGPASGSAIGVCLENLGVIGTSVILARCRAL
jgi:hypothetical protein